jgi:hypothetical protein
MFGPSVQLIFYPRAPRTVRSSSEYATLFTKSSAVLLSFPGTKFGGRLTVTEFRLFRISEPNPFP